MQGGLLIERAPHLAGHDSHLSPVRDRELTHNLADVDLYSLLREIECASNNFVWFTSTQTSKYRLLPGTQFRQLGRWQ